MLLKSPLMLALAGALALVFAPASVEGDDGAFRLTILHHNDASSMLLNAGQGLEGYGGVASFKTLIDQERDRADADGSASVLVSGGNSLLVGPNLQASVEHGVPFYDATAMLTFGYDAVALGSKDFDLGPDVLAAFLCGIVRSGGGAEHPGCGRTGRSDFPLLTANLDFADEPSLQEFVETGGIARSTVVTKDGHAIGFVGVTSPLVPFISSPGGVTVLPGLASHVQAEVDGLTARGVDEIVLLSQLTSLDEQVALAEALHGVDIIVAGGAETVMANPDDVLVPGDVVVQAYPLYATASDGVSVPIVTTGGEYRYLGRLIVEFDSAGHVTAIDPDSGAVRVEAAASPANPILTNAVTEPVQDFLDSLATTVIAGAEVSLDGRQEAIRTRETNLGNLMADAVLWQARASADNFDATPPDVAIVNGGALRLNVLRSAGPLTRLEAFEIAPFASFVSVVEDVSPAQLKLLVENAVSRLSPADGRFGQLAGLRVVHDPAGEALQFDAANRPVNAGSRVVSIQLDDGTYVVRDGMVIEGAPSVTVATLDFLARGGDQYPFDGPTTNLGVTYLQALEAYLAEALEGVISAADYPAGGEGRIVAR